MGSGKPILIVGCAALAGEVAAIARLNHWDHVEVKWLPADLHNHPEKIPAAVTAILEESQDLYEEILVAYADCGTGGQLDTVLAQYGSRRLPGDHCYGFFSGAENFATFHEEEPGTFYLTDFLVRNFDRLVIQGLGLDRHPELHDAYFGNYKRVVYLAQTRSPNLLTRAEACAGKLRLSFEVHFTGLAPFEKALGVPSPESVAHGNSR